MKQAGNERAYLYKLTALGAHSFTGKTARTEDRDLEVGTETQARRNAAYWIIPRLLTQPAFLQLPAPLAHG